MNDITTAFAAGRSRILDAKSEPLTAGGDSSHDSSSYSLSSDNDQLSCNIELKPKPEKPKRFRKRKCHFHDFKQSIPQLVRDGADQVNAGSCRVKKLSSNKASQTGALAVLQPVSNIKQLVTFD